MSVTFVWTGEPGDEEYCESVPGYYCHAELTSDGQDPDDPHPGEAWYCSVSRGRGVVAAGVFHSTDSDVLPLSGPAARRLCEIAARRRPSRQGAGQMAAPLFRRNS